MGEESERRGTSRHRTLKGAKIVLPGHRSLLDCQVRDLSDSGARLRIASTVGVPDSFDLAVSGAPTRHCRVAWRTLEELGVSFE